MALFIKNYMIVASSLHFIAIQSLSSVGKADFHLAYSPSNCLVVCVVNMPVPLSNNGLVT